MRQHIKKALKDSLEGIVSCKKPLRDCTTLKIGGVPHVWVEPFSLEELKRTLKGFKEAKIRPFLIGMGSNMLIYDGKLDIGVIRLSAPCFRKMEFSGCSVKCGSGCSLTAAIKRSMQKGLSGLEQFAGIPATIGGAIMMNAGGASGSIGDLITGIKVINAKNGRISVLKKRQARFDYRDSSLRKYVILEAEFLLKQREPRLIRAEFTARLKKKTASQEHKRPNAGCIFKNPHESTLTAGQLLDRCGLKGARIGGAEISAKHANFIINRGNATFEDVLSLIKLGQDAVKRKFGIMLKPEIEIIR